MARSLVAAGVLRYGGVGSVRVAGRGMAVLAGRDGIALGSALHSGQAVQGSALKVPRGPRRRNAAPPSAGGAAVSS